MDIVINGAIGDWVEEGETNVLNGEGMAAALKDANSTEEINVKINSPGGSVFEGFSMYNQLKALPNPVNTEINGMAASIASLIALAGDNVKMSEVSMMMIHNASTLAMGNKEEIEKQTEVLESIDATLVNVYQAKTGIKKERIESMMNEETWLTSDEALEMKFVDEIINKVDAKMAAIYSIKSNSNIMKLKSLFASFKNEAAEEVATPEVVETPPVIDPEDEETTEEESTEETEAAPEAEYVTMEQFNKLLETIEKMAQSIDENISEAAEKAVDELKIGLKKTNAQPPKANASTTADPTTGWVDPNAKHRIEMQEIEAKTRL